MVMGFEEAKVLPAPTMRTGVSISAGVSLEPLT